MRVKAVAKVWFMDIRVLNIRLYFFLLPLFGFFRFGNVASLV